MCRVQPSLSPCYLPRNLTTMHPLSPTKSPSCYHPIKDPIQGDLGNGAENEKRLAYLLVV